MQRWRESRFGPANGATGAGRVLRLPAPLARQVGQTLQRLGARITAASAGVLPPAVESTGLARARAALTEARQHMPGLLGMATPRPATAVVSSTPAASSAPSTLITEALVTSPEPDTRLARVEEVILQLEAERQQLRSEVAALRLIAEELRETLVRLDERALAPRPALEPAPALELETTDTVYPAGSIGVELRVSGIENAAEPEQLRSAIAAQPGVDAARIVRSRKRKARIRVCLQLPMSAAAFSSLIGRAAPAASTLPGPTPATLLLRLHPS
jgi:hypothetical protein